MLLVITNRHESKTRKHSITQPTELKVRLNILKQSTDQAVSRSGPIREPRPDTPNSEAQKGQTTTEQPRASNRS
jgi:hypothetical protein